MRPRTLLQKLPGLLASPGQKNSTNGETRAKFQTTCNSSQEREGSAGSISTFLCLEPPFRVHTRTPTFFEPALCSLDHRNCRLHRTHKTRLAFGKTRSNTPQVRLGDGPLAALSCCRMVAILCSRGQSLPDPREQSLLLRATPSKPEQTRASQQTTPNPRRCPPTNRPRAVRQPGARENI
jgi:hypothetical protein